MVAGIMAHPHHAAMGFNNPMGQRETQAGAMVLGRVEGSKHFLGFGSGEARTGIINRYKCVSRFLKRKTGIKEKMPSIRHGLDGIMDNILKNLTQ